MEEVCPTERGEANAAPSEAELSPTSGRPEAELR